MSGRPDAFIGFVKALSKCLDDHTTSPEQLAAAVGLSRFHFDRMVAAAAGETPARFRRRVLLERAAYRLLTTDRGILDIALEAGYSSHEAFVRAFRRGYGTAPSMWRARPTRFQLPAPSAVHFHPPSGLRLPAQRKVRSMDLVVRMVEHHVWLIEQMVERASRLDAAALDDPVGSTVEGIDGDATLRWLLSRLIGQLDMWIAAMADVPYDFSVEQGESVLSMRERLARVGPGFVEQVREVSQSERFDETFVDAMRPTPVVVTYGGMIAHVLTFAAHHRILAVDALARHGITDLGFGDPKHWVFEPST